MSQPTPDDGQSLLSVLDELHYLIANARSGPMSAAVKVNKAEALALIAAARDVVPSEIHRAESVVADADHVRHSAESEARALVENAHHEAQSIVAHAQKRAEKLASEDAVVTLARERAAQIVAQAQAEARQLAHGANEYCQSQLATLEGQLAAALQQIHAGRQTLVERAHASGQGGTATGGQGGGATGGQGSTGGTANESAAEVGEGEQWPGQ